MEEGMGYAGGRSPRSGAQVWASWGCISYGDTTRGRLQLVRGPVSQHTGLRPCSRRLAFFATLIWLWMSFWQSSNLCHCSRSHSIFVGNSVGGSNNDGIRYPQGMSSRLEKLL